MSHDALRWVIAIERSPEGLDPGPAVNRIEKRLSSVMAQPPALDYTVASDDQSFDLVVFVSFDDVDRADFHTSLRYQLYDVGPKVHISVPFGNIEGTTFPADPEEEEATYLRRYLEALRDAKRARALAAWEQSSEELIMRLCRLTLERDELERQLAAAYEDRDVAHHRVLQLEALIATLQHEMFGVKHHKSKRQAGQLALVAATWLSPLLGAVGGAVATHALEAHQAAVQVVHDCDIEVDSHDLIINVQAPEQTLPPTK